jgi:hypothetical protein
MCFSTKETELSGIRVCGSNPLVSITKQEQTAAQSKEHEKRRRQKKSSLMLSSITAATNGPMIDARLFTQLQSPTAVFLTCIGKVSGVMAYCTGYIVLIKKK